MELLTRDNFREGVFERDNNQCVICGAPAVDAHHILERRLFSDGGYYLANGASVCERCHIDAEKTVISVEDLRRAIGITKPVLPEHFYSDVIYDKWGNVCQSNGTRLKGELFFDESVQKIIKDQLPFFVDYVKYPRTYHLPWSESLTDDDRYHPDVEFLNGKEVVITEKLDGENCLDGDTLVKTSIGDIPIKTICEEKMQVNVLTYNINTNIYEYEPIANWFIADKNQQWFEIELENGSKLKATENHFIWVKNKNQYVRIKDLEEGDDLLESS